MIDTRKVWVSFGIFISVSLCFILYYVYYGWKLFGYDFVNYQKNDIHLIKNDERMIPSTIVDYDWYSGFLIGLRLNTEFLECKSHNRFRHVIRVSDERHYFIFNIYSEEIFDLASHEIFESKLVLLDLRRKIDLDLSRFDRIVAYYKNIQKNVDYSNCRTLSQP